MTVSIPAAPTISLSTTNIKVCTGTNGCGYLQDFRYLVTANYMKAVGQTPANGSWLCSNTTVTFSCTNPCGVVVATNVTAIVGPCCDPPPANMALWLTFDESSGATCWNSAGANVGTRYVVKNGASTISKLASAQPSRVSGAYVGNCLNFLGDSYVSVPSYPGIEFTTGSFSIDAWVSWTGSFGGSEAILFKRGITSVFPLRYRATRSMLTTMDHLRLNCIPAAATRRSQKLPVLS